METLCRHKKKKQAKHSSEGAWPAARNHPDNTGQKHTTKLLLLTTWNPLSSRSCCQDLEGNSVKCRHYVGTDLLYEFAGELEIWISRGVVAVVVVV
ncbi:hypothetical protein E2C01_086891 [Portunus trituberculatus]|uniref:Uncharacterized protein n=1 Tax=Portunus trituberculatus TaxID=210409 RepID=A0A5B7J214_PORTR|nr:hypothetical protein [Portunus trituberculatus]